MMQGLSTDQAPPFLSVARFFLLAPLFGIVASLLAVYFGLEHLLNRHDTVTIAVIHTITIGFFAQLMLGAMAQMLPVLAGIKLPKVELTAALVHLLLIVGALLFALAFLLNMKNLFFTASAALTAAFTLFFMPLVKQFLKADSKNATINAMRLAALFAVMTVLLGSHLALSRTGIIGQLHLALADIHIAVAFFGFAGLLVAGVAQQVLPMFYVSPPFPKFCRIWIAVIALSLLLFAVGSVSDLIFIKIVGKTVVAVAFTAFGIVALRKLSQRKRRLWDTSLFYWHLSLLFLVTGVLAWVLLAFFEVKNSDYLLAVWLGGGFLMSLMNGMLMKIVPFLVWLHLSSRFVPNLPNIREIMPESLARTQAAMHYVALVCLLASPLGNLPFNVGCVALVASNALLFLIVLRAVRLYTRLLPTAQFSDQFSHFEQSPK